jgi:transcriptional/translational regulatory protein YebC/TACO1
MAPESSEIIQQPSTEIAVDDESAIKVLKLIDALEELDDVHDVFSNAEFPESVLQAEA